MTVPRQNLYSRGICSCGDQWQELYCTVPDSSPRCMSRDELPGEKPIIIQPEFQDRTMREMEDRRYSKGTQGEPLLGGGMAPGTPLE